MSDRAYRADRRIKSYIGVTASVTVCNPGTIDRSGRRSACSIGAARAYRMLLMFEFTTATSNWQTARTIASWTLRGWSSRRLLFPFWSFVAVFILEPGARAPKAQESTAHHDRLRRRTGLMAHLTFNDRRWGVVLLGHVNVIERQGSNTRQSLLAIAQWFHKACCPRGRRRRSGD